MGDEVVLSVESLDIDLAPVNHKDEDSCAEADLHKDYKGCQKNPSHTEFIRLKDFTIDHLPSGYRKKVYVDLIRAEADMTCHLSVAYTSKHRPQYFPGTQNPYPGSQTRGSRTGTGWVKNVYKYTNEDLEICKCEECTIRGTHTLKKLGVKVEIITACHMVYNSEEARHTKCYFFYDEPTITISQCPKLTGLEVVKSDTTGDMSIMTCVTHDTDLVPKLIKMYERRLRLFAKMRSKYWFYHEIGRSRSSMSCIKLPTPRQIAIISHPHGCCKHITIGEWTERETQGDAKIYEDENSGLQVKYIYTSYKYSAATCPGSSGAPVVRLVEKGMLGWWCVLGYHPHSKRGEENHNYSGVMCELLYWNSLPKTGWSKPTLPLISLALFVVPGLIIAFGVVFMTKWEYALLVVCLDAFRILCWWICCQPFRDRTNLPHAVEVLLTLGLQLPFWVLALIYLNHPLAMPVILSSYGVGILLTILMHFVIPKKGTRFSLNLQRWMRQVTTRCSSRGPMNV